MLSGKVGDYDRDHWIDRLAEVGAQPQLKITKKTTLLVTGADAGKGKASDAEKRRTNGQPIRIISDSDMIALLTQVQTEGAAAPPSPQAETEEPARAERQPAEQPASVLESPPPAHPETASPVEDQPAGGSEAVGEHNAITFQQWSGAPGSLPAGWTLTMQHRGRQRRITTTTLNRSPTGLLKRLGICVGIIVGSFFLAAALTPVLGPAAPVVFLGGIAYSIVFLIRSARAEKLRWQYWAGKPEQRKVLTASADDAFGNKRGRG